MQPDQRPVAGAIPTTTAAAASVQHHHHHHHQQQQHHYGKLHRTPQPGIKNGTMPQSAIPETTLPVVVSEQNRTPDNRAPVESSSATERAAVVAATKVVTATEVVTASARTTAVVATKTATPLEEQQQRIPDINSTVLSAAATTTTPAVASTTTTASTSTSAATIVALKNPTHHPEKIPHNNNNKHDKDIVVASASHVADPKSSSMSARLGSSSATATTSVDCDSTVNSTNQQQNIAVSTIQTKSWVLDEDDEYFHVPPLLRTVSTHPSDSNFVILRQGCKRKRNDSTTTTATMGNTRSSICQSSKNTNNTPGMHLLPLELLGYNSAAWEIWYDTIHSTKNERQSSASFRAIPKYYWQPQLHDNNNSATMQHRLLQPPPDPVARRASAGNAGFVFANGDTTSTTNTSNIISNISSSSSVSSPSLNNQTGPTAPSSEEPGIILESVNPETNNIQGTLRVLPSLTTHTEPVNLNSTKTINTESNRIQTRNRNSFEFRNSPVGRRRHHHDFTTTPRAADSASSRIGKEYQAVLDDFVPVETTGASIGRIRLLAETEYRPLNWVVDSSTSVDQIWDPVRAEAAQQRGEAIDQFLGQSNTLNVLTLLMEALHQGNYNVEASKRKFVALFALRKNVVSLQLNESQSKMFNSFCNKDQKMEIVDCARKMKCRPDVVMVHYYQWKSSQGSNARYKRMKALRKRESDECGICQEGGELIVCDRCHNAYHLTCLIPPLTAVPDGEWYCSNCEQRSPAMVRRHSGYNKLDTSSPRQKSSASDQMESQSGSSIARRPFPHSASLAAHRISDLRLVHKELNPTVESHSSVKAKSSQKTNKKTSALLPCGMTWDATRGAHVTNSTESLFSKDRGGDPPPSNKAALSLLARGRIDGQNVNKSSSISNNISIELSSAVRYEVRPSKLHGVGVTYFVRIPYNPSPDLLALNVGYNRLTGLAMFSGYRKMSSGRDGPARQGNVFISEHDIILAVNNVPCDKLCFKDVKKLLLPKPSSKYVILKMWHATRDPPNEQPIRNNPINVQNIPEREPQCAADISIELSSDESSSSNLRGNIPVSTAIQAECIDSVGTSQRQYDRTLTSINTKDTSTSTVANNSLPDVRRPHLPNIPLTGNQAKISPAANNFEPSPIVHNNVRRPHLPHIPLTVNQAKISTAASNLEPSPMVQNSNISHESIPSGRVLQSHPSSSLRGNPHQIQPFIPRDYEGSSVRGAPRLQSSDSRALFCAGQIPPQNHNQHSASATDGTSHPNGGVAPIYDSIVTSYSGIHLLTTPMLVGFLRVRGILRSEAFLDANPAVLATDLSREANVSYDMALDFLGTARFDTRKMLQRQYQG